VVKLNERRVLEDIAPPEIGVVRNVAVESVEQLLLGRSQTKTHVRELVVDKTGIKTSDKTSRHGSSEDQNQKSTNTAAEELEFRYHHLLENLR
jgi:hypothetical protein